MPPQPHTLSSALTLSLALTRFAPLAASTGVLQALGVAFFIVATLSALFPPPPSPHSVPSAPFETPRRVWTRFVLRHALVGLAPLVLVNLAVVYWLRVPGCPTGYVGPGGTADGGAFRNCTGGAHLYVDTLVFGRDHLLQTPTCQAAFATGAFDPEGALNWLMVAATTYLGYITAALVVAWRPGPATQPLALCGAVLVALSVVCGGVVVSPSPWIPLNKNLWSLSFVLLTAGLACWGQAACVAVVDMSAAHGSSSTCRWRWRWSGWPLLAVGKNSIAVYVLVRARASVARSA